ncbi:MAG TPA: hypothetical protein PLS69_08890, partial [Terricaulis sp.]|nr:hypothetical protein [Terricaulis sp.]
MPKIEAIKVGGTNAMVASESAFNKETLVAARIGVQVGTQLLHMPMGGKGKLLGGLPSTGRGSVVVFGAGRAGGAAAA